MVYCETKEFLFLKFIISFFFSTGIGVPILLAYVYGVVPISLCRSGGCGVTATNKGGVRFEFDEENETVGPAGPGISGF